MVDVEQLAKLKELHAEGVLTDEEFAAAKKGLLNPEPATPVTKKLSVPIIAGALATVALAALAYTVLGSGNADKVGPNDVVKPEATIEATDAVEIEPVQVAKSQPSNYQWSVSPDVLGLNPAFVEQRLGVAKSKSESHLDFEIDGCDVSYSVDNKSITLIFATVTSKCNPIVNGKTITAKTTFASLLENGQLLASCLLMCGNASDPTIDVVSLGASYNSFVDYRYWGKYNDATSKAMDVWLEAIAVENGLSPDQYFDLPTEKTNCVSNAPAKVAALMKHQTVTTVTIGRDSSIGC